MITKRLKSVCYLIEGRDEMGVIPEDVKACIVEYEESRGGKNAVSVNFIPSVEIDGKSVDGEEQKKYQEIHQRTNYPRTKEEIRKIAGILERSLKD